MFVLRDVLFAPGGPSDAPKPNGYGSKWKPGIGPQVLFLASTFSGKPFGVQQFPFLTQTRRNLSYSCCDTTKLEEVIAQVAASAFAEKDGRSVGRGWTRGPIFFAFGEEGRL